mgnify:CR=1 FL=1
MISKKKTRKEKKKMKKIKKAVVMAVVTLLTASTLVGCGGSGDKGGKTEITFFAGVSADNGDAYKKMVETYNKTQGDIDGVYVNYKPKASTYDADLSTVFAGKMVPDVVTISDQYFKGYTKDGNLYNIQKLVDNEKLITKNKDGEVNLDWSKIPVAMTNRFRIDWEKKSSGNEKDDLYAVPNGANPTMIFYNADAFTEIGINIISVAEEDLEAYNSKNGTKYMPHGYAEYAESAAPASGLKTSKNLAGQTVVKVFNNQIPLNWNELLVLSKSCTKSYNTASVTEYGFLNEWWFSHGWSVGGDCMMWDEAKQQYIFSLGNTTPGYLAVKDVTVNGTSYKAGDVLTNVDKVYLSNNPAEVTEALYQLPSQYDAFAEFCALSQTKGAAVDLAGKVGYGVSPSPAKLGSYGKSTFFTASNVAMAVLELEAMNTVAQSLAGQFAWDIAPNVQYREYEGGDLNADGTLKVIGVDGYTGALKTVEGTAVVGKQAGSSLNLCFAIPANAPNPEAAYKFIQWAAGAEGQEILASGNTQVPNYQETGLSDEFLTSEARLCKNYSVAVKSAVYEEIGDWSYLEDGEWVNHWANLLNTDVRNGEMLLDAFFSNETVTQFADINLGKYEIRIDKK